MLAERQGGGQARADPPRGTREEEVKQRLAAILARRAEQRPLDKQVPQGRVRSRAAFNARRNQEREKRQEEIREKRA